MIIYTVKKGDSLSSIARTYQSDVAALVAANGIDAKDSLIVGQSLIIPSASNIHIVQPGDTLYSIAKANHLTVSDLLAFNPYIYKPFRIYPGQQIILRRQTKPKVEMRVNGYAFSETKDQYLDEAKNELTYISPFSYRYESDGSLVALNDERILTWAKAEGVAPILVLTNTTPKGSFSSDHAHLLLSQKNVQQRLFNELETTLKNKGYVGVNIDFEYVFGSDGQDLIRFFKDLKDTLGDRYEISIALAPKYRGEQTGLLYEAHDYQALGEIADRVVLMTYEWGYTYGPAMGVAPLHLVEKVLQYAVSVIEPSKINLGIPAYGYDFIVPHQKGTKAQSLSLEGALALARQRKSSILYDQEAETPYFYYYQDGQKHEVYFEDARSLEAKIQLAINFRLGGLSIWTMRSPLVPLWTLIHDRIDVLKIY